MEGVSGKSSFAAARFAVHVEAGKVFVKVNPVVLVDGCVPVYKR
jgi:hypothetical protein